MTDEATIEETVDLLQNLGLQEYEARCFLGLTQIETGTAKQLSEITEVPRTRVYDAVRVLEAQGLVEVQHSTPQRFRAVSIDEATRTLQQQFDTRITTLNSNLERLDLDTRPDDGDHVQEVWSLTGHEGIESRMHSLLDQAESEIVMVVVEDAVLTEALFDRLHEAVDRGVEIVLGGDTDAIISQLDTELPSITVFETDLDWFEGPEGDSEVALSRLLLVDRTSLLVSSATPADDRGGFQEKAIFATGLENGIVILIRRILTSGLLPVADPSP